MWIFTREIQGPELGEAKQCSVVDLQDLVVAEDMELEAGRKLERRDGLQVVVGQVEASQCREFSSPGNIPMSLTSLMLL